jgi:hypothetical protein
MLSRTGLSAREPEALLLCIEQQFSPEFKPPTLAIG